MSTLGIITARGITLHRHFSHS